MGGHLGLWIIIHRPLEHVNPNSDLWIVTRIGRVGSVEMQPRIFLEEKRFHRKRNGGVRRSPRPFSETTVQFK